MPLEKRVWDVMDSNFETVTPETPLKEACAILSSKNRGKRGLLGLVVMRTSGEYLGLLTTKEILRYLLYLYNKSRREGKEDDWPKSLIDLDQDGSWVTVNDVLISYEVSARPNQSLSEAIRLMEENDLEILPVSDGGKIIGVIQSSDILGVMISK
jgi:CBS domain-containing protein